MMKVLFITCLMLLGLWQHAFSQKPKLIKRESTIELILKKKALESFKFILDSTDVLNINVNAKRRTNVRVMAPDSQVLFETKVRLDAIQWSENITLAGEYTIELENTNKYLWTKSLLNVVLERKDFVYGDPTMIDSLKIGREQVPVLDSESQITKANPKEYPIAVNKGDTLQFFISPLSGRTPFVKLENDLGEVLWSAIPKKNKIKMTVPVLTDGSYKLSMNSTAFWSKTNQLTIEKTSPEKFKEPTFVPLDTTQVEEEIILYDTIAEMFIDTLLHLGAVRDIIHDSQQKISFEFDKVDDMVSWGVLFGAGKSYHQRMASIKPLFANEAYLAAGITDVLSAYGLGMLDVLPKTDLDYLSFDASEEIKANLDPSYGNFAIIPTTKNKQFLLFENKSKSSRQIVHVIVVVFKIVQR